jgi:hypothetical protein
VSLEYGSTFFISLRIILELAIVTSLGPSDTYITLCRPILLFLRFLSSIRDWCETWEQLHSACNPHLRLDDYTEQREDQALEGFTVHKFPYKRLSAKHESWRMILGSWWFRFRRWPHSLELRPTLYGYVCIPLGLKKGEEMGLAFGDHGGGMVSLTRIDYITNAHESRQPVIRSTPHGNLVHYLKRRNTTGLSLCFQSVARSQIRRVAGLWKILPSSCN